MTPANDHRARVYEARHGLIWTFGGGSVRSVTEAVDALPAMVDLALTERSEDLARAWMFQLEDLIAAIREARSQGKEADAKEQKAAA